MSDGKRYEYDAALHETPDNGGAYVAFPWNIRETFGKGRVKVHALFDGIPYDGSIVNMGVKHGVLSSMNPTNHHLKSLAHSPDPVGLVFSIIDQFSGSGSFFDNGQIIHAVPKKTSGAFPYMEGKTFTGKEM